MTAGRPPASGAAPAEKGIVRTNAGDPLSARAWRMARGTVSLARPVVVGVLNVTPDSFWSGSRQVSLDEAIASAAAMIEAGADMLDVGGESSRPGAFHVEAAEEIARVVPLVREVGRRWPELPISVDTVKGEVAYAALNAGAWAVNDVSALRLDPGLAGIVAKSGAGLILMHSRGTIATMASYDTAEYGEDPVGEMVAELAVAVETAEAAGVGAEAVVIDPGVGFSKRTEHSVAALSALHRFASLGKPILVGASRKRFVGELAGGLPVEARLEATLGACVAALARGARLFRVHDVRPARHALDVADAILKATR